MRSALLAVANTSNKDTNPDPWRVTIWLWGRFRERARLPELLKRVGQEIH